ncbi:DUF1349 domain-containing protein [Umezawaea endophytica]|uniref:DUF1349 domain-containing protein n=1 Tax=Umezawaea endophytica TaxID=1654476 RepID=A0A9X3A572_9PSEU|nr:DUF1349 domain-containing protein [Umezawaea endophytica]MCS7481963.1 DUF1349 domain-containing protein [Umezawaea endophytica]
MTTTPWSEFRARGRIAVAAAATVLAVLPGLVLAFADRSSCSAGEVEVECPTDPVGPQGTSVSDRFTFAHRPLGREGTITARLTSMTGVITYPPPNHDEIVDGLVPWAKAGLVIKDGTAPGSSYAALVMTGEHGVRMQHDYIHDTAGSPGPLSAPRWLRLTRSGDVVTGEESADGRRWTTVGTAALPGLPETVRVGLLVTSPGNLTLVPTGLGASAGQSRFTQATGVFDGVEVDGAPVTGWTGTQVGESGTTDWEKDHRAAGVVESGGTVTVSGSGDVSPAATVGGRSPEGLLVGLVLGLLVLAVVAARFAPRNDPGALPGRAVVVGAVSFLSGLVAAAVVIPVGSAILRANGGALVPVPLLVELRVVVGVGVLAAAVSVLTLALSTVLRRAWAAVLVVVGAVLLPYAMGVLPLLPDEVSRWLLRVTPAAGFAVQQTAEEFPQVVAHYVPAMGYYPLPWWAGVLVLLAWTGGVVRVALGRGGRRADREAPAARSYTFQDPFQPS